MADLLTSIRAEIDARLRELAPAIAEHEQLSTAVDVLAAEGNVAPRPVPRSAARPATRAVPEPDASGVRVYKGIPYAAPPIGPLRWRPPESVAAWTGVRPTQDFGAHSVQGVVWDDIDLSGVQTSEDCLFLNVWTPAAPRTEARLAVMVWIHGGGFVVGSGAEPRYDGARLAARGIVVVTVNHRLNALGFLAHNST